MHTDEPMPTREMVLNYFRSEHYTEEMNDCDKEEIAFYGIDSDIMERVLQVLFKMRNQGLDLEESREIGAFLISTEHYMREATQ